MFENMRSLFSSLVAETAVRAPNNSLLGILLFLVVIGIGFFLFWRRVQPLVKLIRQGQPEDRSDQIGKRVGFFLTGWIFQKKLFRKLVPGTIHALLFWGFLIINVGVLYSIFYGMFPVHLPILSSRPLAVIIDLFLIVVLLSLVYFGIRRLFIKPRYLTMSKDGFIVITFITLSVVFEFLIEAFAWRASPSPETGYAFLGRRLGELLIPAASNWPTANEAPQNVRDLAQTLWSVFWWAKIVNVMVFLVYIPTSKHFHVITTIFNTFFQSTKPKGQLAKVENIEDLEHYGKSKVEDFTWKDLLDTTACTECGRCTQVCPANATGKPLNPKKIIIDLKTQLFNQSHIPLVGHSVSVGGTRNDGGENLDATVQAQAGTIVTTEGAADGGGAAYPPLPPLVGGMITQDELWACTTCRACMTECPVFIEHVPKIVDMRRYLVMEESEFPPEVTSLFNNLERNGNPWQIRPDERMEWASKMPFDIRVLAEMDEGQDVDILLWVGCMGALDQRNKKITQNLATIMEEAGLNWAILGPEESCTGDPARRIGNEYLFQMLADQNVETLNGYKEKHHLKKIVTACPHCMNSLKNDYPAFGLHFEVIHHTQLVASLIEEGKLTTGAGLDGKKVTYHDPCYLGRYNDVYDAPRFVLNSLGDGLKKATATLPGADGGSNPAASGPSKIEFVEMPRNKSKSFCCGGGGGRMWMEEHIGTRINETRVQEAVNTGADVVAASCPFCISMFEAAITNKDIGDKFKVMDITELVQASKQPRTAVSGAQSSSGSSPAPEE